MKNLFFYFVLFIFCSLYSSCGKVDFDNSIEFQQRISSMPTLQIALGMMNDPNKAGQVTITSQKGLGENNNQGGGTISGQMYEGANFGNIVVNNIEVTQHSYPQGIYSSNLNNNILQMFNSEVTCKLYNAQNEQVLEAGHKIYKELNTYIPTEMTRNSTISWNSDETNDKGVYFVIEYTNEDIEGSPTYAKVIQTNDDGSYTFTNEDFGIIPPNSNVIIRMIRGNYTKEILNNKSLYIFSGTIAYGRYKL